MCGRSENFAHRSLRRCIMNKQKTVDSKVLAILKNAPKRGMTICSLSFAITTDTAI